MVDTETRDFTSKSPMVATDEWYINDVAGGNVDKKLVASVVKTFMSLSPTLVTPASLGVQQQALNMNTNLINGVVDPTTDQQAATKKYVDDNVAGLPVPDTQTIVEGSADATKLMRFEVDGLTTGTTRVLTLPDKDLTLVGTVDNLSVFAATTSLQLKGVISDETGSGALVFGTSPTFVTPALGTPASGVATNLTGASGITGLGVQGQTLDIGGNNIDNIQNLIHDISASGTDIDFAEDEVQTISISANTTFTTANRVAGKSKLLKITTAGTLRTLTFPAWDWVSAIPADQAASKNGYLTLTSYSTTDAAITAAYQVGSL